MMVNKSFPVERLAPLTPEDARDLEILDAIASGPPDPEICWLLGVSGGEVTAMREAWEDAE